ncbi:Lsr2 family DNA-binding protein [Micromonospora nigra]|uniref:Lsr2 family DNA-binding protein n=1 Tax=Micromonospora nigra TaxID=145857 RepID=UPI001C3130A4|nr:histone-like nucleoid-structuring protein Lsr2 [Micromonospora nigra]
MSETVETAATDTLTAKPATIRAWARDNGHAIGERGRIPASVKAAFEQATGNKAA